MKTLFDELPETVIDALEQWDAGKILWSEAKDIEGIQEGLEELDKQFFTTIKRLFEGK